MQHIKEMMKSGDVQGAAAELKTLLAAEPDNAEAQMLYGTCCHLLGDDKAFVEIHDALAPKMEKERDEKKLSLWRKYHALWLTLIAGALVLAGTLGGAYYYGKSKQYSAVKALSGPNEPVDFEKRCMSLYAGPPREMEFKKFTDVDSVNGKSWR